MEKNLKRSIYSYIYIYIYIMKSLCCIPEHCEPTLLQQKINFKKEPNFKYVKFEMSVKFPRRQLTLSFGVQRRLDC